MSPDENLFRRAFELAYFIHPQNHLALRIAESALHKLAHSFGRQGRRAVYVPSGRRHTHNSPPQPLRTKVALREEHLLQALIYAESDSWERSSEQDGGPYQLTEEDMIIRFIKHLVQITLKRNSFYVTLGVGRLLYDYDTSQVRQMYDVLMQDQSRFRDNSYLRRQKNVLMKEILSRFDQMVRIVRTPQREDRFQSQPVTPTLLQLVRECLVRFTPWDTVCVFPEKFDPVARIPELCFTGSDPDEESPVEMNRIHTVIDPNCFLRLTSSLGYPPPDERLAVPHFFFSEDNEPRGDRFNPPPVSAEQETRFKKSVEDRARRRKAYRAGLLHIYVDDIETINFDPARHDNVNFKIVSSANVIEVRAKDQEGELLLGTQVLSTLDIPSEGSVSDSLTLEGGQKLTIVLSALPTTAEEPDEFEVEVSYAETQPLRAVAFMVRRAFLRLTSASGDVEEKRILRPAYFWPIAIAVVLVIVTLLILWGKRDSRQTPPAQQAEVLPSPAPQVSIEPSPVKSPDRQPSPSTPRDDVAHVAWIRDPKAVDSAIRVELRRGGSPTVEIAGNARLLLAVNRFDVNNQRYGRYRLVLNAMDQSIWERILPAPKETIDDHLHVFSLELTIRRLPKADTYKLRVDGETRGRWENLGEIVLSPR